MEQYSISGETKYTQLPPGTKREVCSGVLGLFCLLADFMKMSLIVNLFPYKYAFLVEMDYLARRLGKPVLISVSFDWLILVLLN